MSNDFPADIEECFGFGLLGKLPFERVDDFVALLIHFILDFIDAVPAIILVFITALILKLQG